jgi:hypothetical protein
MKFLDSRTDELVMLQATHKLPIGKARTVSDKAAKVASHYTVPCRTLAAVKL